MTCRDFQRICDELLDADTDGEPRDDDTARLAAHAAECPACRAIDARYQLLRQAIRAWRQPPTPPPGLVDRILAAAEPETATIPAATERPWPMNREGWRAIAGLAATVLIAASLALLLPRFARTDRTAPHPPVLADHPADRTATPGVAPRPAKEHSPSINRALADATSATWDLARSASEPAARLGREVLADDDDERASRPGSAAPMTSAHRAEGLASLSVPVPSLEPLAPDAAAVLQQVGDRLSAGVRPLSSTARQAFGFLLGPDRWPIRPAGTRTEPTSS